MSTKALPSHRAHEEFEEYKDYRIDECYAVEPIIDWLERDSRVEAYSRQDYSMILVVESPYFSMGTTSRRSIADDLHSAFPNMLNITRYTHPYHVGGFTWRHLLYVTIVWKRNSGGTTSVARLDTNIES